MALVDADDRHHSVLAALFRQDPTAWILAVLSEVDYLLGAHVGRRAQDALLADLGAGVFRVEWGGDADLSRANELNARYRSLRLGLVDGVVIAIAERLRAKAVATLDLRHLGAVEIRGRPRVIPRDL